jgi:drug/metabolite transporter (DMT)-like permease
MSIAPAGTTRGRSLGGEGHRALLLMCVFALAWALLEGVVGAQLQNPYSLMQIVWCRYAAHLLLMLLVWGWREPSRLWRTRRPVFHLVRSLCMLVMPLSFAMALHVGDGIHTVWALFWVAPVMILALAVWWLGERVPVTAWLAVALGLLATYLMLDPRWPSSLGTLVWPLIMAMSFALYVAMTRSLRNEPVLTNLFYTALGVFALLSLAMPWSWTVPTLHDGVVLTTIGVVGFGALWALDQACEASQLSSTAPALYLHLAGMVMIESMARSAWLSRREMLALGLIALVVATAWRMQSAGRSGMRAPLKSN